MSNAINFTQIYCFEDIRVHGIICIYKFYTLVADLNSIHYFIYIFITIHSNQMYEFYKDF